MQSDGGVRADDAAPLARKPHRLRRLAAQSWESWLLVVLLLTLWQLATSVLGVPSYLVPSPETVVATIIARWSSIAENGLVTLFVTVASFFAAIVLGGRQRRSDLRLSPR